jgi:Putative zinc-finger
VPLVIVSVAFAATVEVPIAASGSLELNDALVDASTNALNVYVPGAIWPVVEFDPLVSRNNVVAPNRSTEALAPLFLCPEDVAEPEIENVDGTLTVNWMTPPIDCSPSALSSAPSPLTWAWAWPLADSENVAPVDDKLALVEPVPLAEALALQGLFAGGHVPLAVASGGDADEPPPHGAGAGCGPEWSTGLAADTWADVKPAPSSATLHCVSWTGGVAAPEAEANRHHEARTAIRAPAERMRMTRDSLRLPHARHYGRPPVFCAVRTSFARARVTTSMSGFSQQGRFARDHRWAPDRMSAYVDMELAASARERMERHIGECAECRQLLAGLRATLDVLHRLPAPSADAVRIVAEVRVRLSERPAIE